MLLNPGGETIKENVERLQNSGSFDAGGICIEIVPGGKPTLSCTFEGSDFCFVVGDLLAAPRRPVDGEFDPAIEVGGEADSHTYRAVIQNGTP